MASSKADTTATFNQTKDAYNKTRNASNQAKSNAYL